MNICTAYFPTITYFFAPCWPIVNYGFYLKQQFPAIVQLLSETVAQSIDTCYLKYHPQPLFPYYSKPQPQSPCTLVTWKPRLSPCPLVTWNRSPSLCPRKWRRGGPPDHISNLFLLQGTWFIRILILIIMKCGSVSIIDLSLNLLLPQS